MGRVASKYLISISWKWLTILEAAGPARATVALGIARKEAVMVISHTPSMENAASITITWHVRQNLGVAARSMAGKPSYIESPTEDLASGHSCGNSSEFCGTGCQSGQCIAFSSASSSTTKPTSTATPFTITQDGTCGFSNKLVCKGSKFGNCCSAAGYCGSDAYHCSNFLGW